MGVSHLNPHSMRLLAGLPLIGMRRRGGLYKWRINSELNIRTGTA
jgi:hypothetical protein